jgi:hypothetical protein
MFYAHSYNRDAASPYPGGLGFLPTCVLNVCKYEIHMIDNPWLYAPWMTRSM